MPKSLSFVINSSQTVFTLSDLDPKSKDEKVFRNKVFSLFGDDFPRISRRHVIRVLYLTPEGSNYMQQELSHQILTFLDQVTRVLPESRISIEFEDIPISLEELAWYSSTAKTRLSNSSDSHERCKENVLKRIDLISKQVYQKDHLLHFHHRLTHSEDEGLQDTKISSIYVVLSNAEEEGIVEVPPIEHNNRLVLVASRRGSINHTVNRFLKKQLFSIDVEEITQKAIKSLIPDYNMQLKLDEGAIITPLELELIRRRRIIGNYRLFQQNVEQLNYHLTKLWPTSQFPQLSALPDALISMQSNPALSRIIFNTLLFPAFMLVVVDEKKFQGFIYHVDQLQRTLTELEEMATAGNTVSTWQSLEAFSLELHKSSDALIEIALDFMKQYTKYTMDLTYLQQLLIM